MQRGPLTNEQKAQRAAAREASASHRAAARARRRAEVLRTGAGYLRWYDMAALLGVNPSTLWRWVKDGRFTAPKRFGKGGVVGWDAATALDCLARNARGTIEAPAPPEPARNERGEAA